MSIRFYTDTHISKQVAIQLRNKGIEVVRCEEVSMAEADDEHHLEYASQNGLALITKDRGFSDRHYQWVAENKSHSGIFYCGERSRSAIGLIVNGCTEYVELIQGGAGNINDIENEFIDIT
jgi:predicted nuclease of predicted toxin-antitoxin system